MHKHLNNMRNLKGGESVVGELLDKWAISQQCQAFFNDIVKCDVIDNNMCETFNGVLVDTRSNLILIMLKTLDNM